MGGRRRFMLMYNSNSWKNWIHSGYYDEIGEDKFGLEFPFPNMFFGYSDIEKKDGVWNIVKNGKCIGVYKLGYDQESPYGKWSDGECIDPS